VLGRLERSQLPDPPAQDPCTGESMQWQGLPSRSCRRQVLLMLLLGWLDWGKL